MLIDVANALLTLLIRNLRDTVSVTTIENAHRLLGNRVCMILQRAVRRSVRAILLSAENLGLLLLNNRSTVVELALLTLLHRGQNVLLLLDLLNLFGLHFRLVQS